MATSFNPRIAAKKPHLRKAEINDGLYNLNYDGLYNLNSTFQKDQFAKEFGLSLSGKMLPVTGRVLEPPKLQYLNKSVTPALGQWTPAGGKFITCMKLFNWAIIDLEKVYQKRFLDTLKSEAQKFGLAIEDPKRIVNSYARGKKLEDDFKELVGSLKPQLIMVIMRFKDSQVYGRVKFLGDGLFDIPTQVLLERSVDRCNPSLAHNICLKLNSKLGGTNQRLAEVPDILKKPVILLGADVTHASPGEQRPSLAAVVGSVDPEALSVYHCLVSIQERQGAHAEERILNLKEMTKKLLIKFRETSGQKPEKIIYYRDGVSEGQFEDILNSEISAIQGACKSLQEGYEPGITFLVVQKRHHTRFFPESKDDCVRSGNVLPGTVVDEQITHPTQQSFYLCSHEGIQGTSKPAHYHLLYDDNNLSANELQKLSYYLCHLYSRCERSVSYPAPTYYAHLCAFRARYHYEVLISQGKEKDREERKKIEEMKVPNYFV